jgi:hypothetical protein
MPHGLGAQQQNLVLSQPSLPHCPKYNMHSNLSLPFPEICFDHMKKTALNTYLGDMIQGRVARIPSSSDDHGLQYIPIPIHQAQMGVVSSAGMSINANSMALVQNGTLFLQDGMTNATSYQYIDRKL